MSSAISNSMGGGINHQTSSSSTTTTGSGGTLMASHSAPIAPIIEPPKEFGYVAPGIYRCSASNLVKGLSPAPKRWQLSQQNQQPKLMQIDSSRTITTIHAPQMSQAGGSNSSFLNEGDQNDLNFFSPSNGQSINKNSNPSTPPTNATTTEAFLSSLQLRMILLIAPEKMPSALAAWCALHNVKLIHLGLGALADSIRAKDGQRSSNNAIDEFSSSAGVLSQRSDPLMGNGTINNFYANSSSADMMSLERIAKESLELILNKNNLPCLICDMSGVNETGIVVGCLRRLQRFNFASIRLEYRNFAGNRARSSNERFIEMFDTDLIDLPPQEQLPVWLVEQIAEDEKEE